MLRVTWSSSASLQWAIVKATGLATRAPLFQDGNELISVLEQIIDGVLTSNR
jgi:hypothetical protein